MNKTYMAFGRGKTKALTLSYDDGVKQDAALIKLMDAHGVKGTFNINSGEFGQKERRLTEAECVGLYKNSAHEVAVHGLNHAHIQCLPPAAAYEEVMQDRRNLEALFETPVRGMAYAFGTYNQTALEVLKIAGIAYSRTTKSTERFDLPENWLELHPTCHHRNPALFDLFQRFVQNASPNPKLFYLWGHSYEFDDNGDWSLIEDFLKTAGGRDDIWYATNIEIYDCAQAYRWLQFSAAGDRVHNPSARVVWLSKNGEFIPVKSGETLRLS